MWSIDGSGDAWRRPHFSGEEPSDLDDIRACALWLPAHALEIRLLDGREVVPVGEIAHAIASSAIPHQRGWFDRETLDASILRIDTGRAPDPIAFIPATLDRPALCLLDENERLVVLDGRRRARQVLEAGADRVPMIVVRKADVRHYFTEVDDGRKRTKTREPPLLFPPRDGATGVDAVVLPPPPRVDGHPPRLGTAAVVHAVVLVLLDETIKREKSRRESLNTRRNNRKFTRDEFLSSIAGEIDGQIVRFTWSRNPRYLSDNIEDARGDLGNYSEFYICDRDALGRELVDCDEPELHRRLILFDRAWRAVEWHGHSTYVHKKSLRNGRSSRTIAEELTGSEAAAEKRRLGRNARIDIALLTGIDLTPYIPYGKRDRELLQWICRGFFLRRGRSQPLADPYMARQFLYWAGWVKIHAEEASPVGGEEYDLLLKWYDLILALSSIGPEQNATIDSCSDGAGFSFDECRKLLGQGPTSPLGQILHATTEKGVFLLNGSRD